MPDEITERYCKDCRWSRHMAKGTDWESWKCHNPKQLPRPRRRSLNDGEMEQPLWRECERLRRDKISGINTTLTPQGAKEVKEFLRVNPTCGPEGKWWEPKKAGYGLCFQFDRARADGASVLQAHGKGDQAVKLEARQNVMDTLRLYVGELLISLSLVIMPKDHPHTAYWASGIHAATVAIKQGRVRA